MPCVSDDADAAVLVRAERNPQAPNSKSSRDLNGCPMDRVHWGGHTSNWSIFRATKMVVQRSPPVGVQWFCEGGRVCAVRSVRMRPSSYH